jgi:PIN domain nuclease of toxin-antitoxin system
VGLGNVEAAVHADPADRIIVATSRALRAPLLSADERLRNYPHLSVIW